jgi:hypothetical protein
LGVHLGQRVRVTDRSGHKRAATLVQFRNDSLHLTSFAIPLSSVARIQPSAGRNRLAGAGRGAVIGGLASGVILGILYASTASYPTDSARNPAEGLFYGMLLGAPLGVLPGAVVGGVVGAEQWERGVSFSPRPQRTATGVQVGFSFPVRQRGQSPPR